MDLDYTLYDTAIFGTVANFESVLFQVAQGADVTHIESFTNMRGAGALPQEEAFKCNWIGVAVDFTSTLPQDYKAMWLGSFLEFRLSDKTVLKAPLAMFAAASGFSGHYSQAAAADNAAIGLMGNGYTLDIPIEISGGTAFRVRIVQGTVLSAVSKNVKVLLNGILTTK